MQKALKIISRVEPSKPSQPQETVLFIRPSSGWSALNLGELWRFRELIYFLTWRDVKVRYKQTALGAAWAILQPFLTMVVFTIFFGRLAKVPSDGVPYPIFSYTGLLPWGLFTKALTDAGRSLVANRTMITKIYFPRLVIPIASVLGGVVDFALAFLVLIGMMLYYNYAPNSTYHVELTPAVLTLPFFLLLAIVTALGVGLWLSALNVLYRDINYILPFLTQFWLFITPMAYPASMIPEQLAADLRPQPDDRRGGRLPLGAAGHGRSARPDAGGFDHDRHPGDLVTGLFYFRRMERTFADVV